MNPLLAVWLEELRETPLTLGEAPGSGGAANAWSVTVPPEISEEELVDFLQEARLIRLAQASRHSPGPATFYAWHDAQAGQIRFSVARGGFPDLPFGARL